MANKEQDDFQELLNQMAGTCIAVRTRLINRVVTSIFDEALRPFGVKVSQMNILVAVSLYGPLQPSALSRPLHITPSTLSRNIDRMKTKGWIATHSCEDGRAHTITLAPQGLEIIKAAFPAWKAAQEKATSILGPQGVKVLTEIADTMLFGSA